MDVKLKTFELKSVLRIKPGDEFEHVGSLRIKPRLSTHQQGHELSNKDAEALRDGLNQLLVDMSLTQEHGLDGRNLPLDAV